MNHCVRVPDWMCTHDRWSRAASTGGLVSCSMPLDARSSRSIRVDPVAAGSGESDVRGRTYRIRARPVPGQGWHH